MINGFDFSFRKEREHFSWGHITVKYVSYEALGVVNACSTVGFDGPMNGRVLSIYFHAKSFSEKFHEPTDADNDDVLERQENDLMTFCTSLFEHKKCKRLELRMDDELSEHLKRIIYRAHIKAYRTVPILRLMSHSVFL